jgi:hypothetical protein
MSVVMGSSFYIRSLHRENAIFGEENVAGQGKETLKCGHMRTQSCSAPRALGKENRELMQAASGMMRSAGAFCVGLQIHVHRSSLGRMAPEQCREKRCRYSWSTDVGKLFQGTSQNENRKWAKRSV